MLFNKSKFRFVQAFNPPSLGSPASMRAATVAVDLETDDLVQAKKETILYSMAKNAGIAAYFSYLILSCLNGAQILFRSCRFFEKPHYSFNPCK